MLITISGTPGSGKTTVARLLAKQLNLPHVYAGDLFRAEAQQRGLTLAQFNELAEQDHSVDRALDERMAGHVRTGNVVLEGRLAAFLARQAGVEALKVWVTASEAVRAARVSEREGGDQLERLKQNDARQRSDAKRYREIYGFDLDDLTIYDLIVHSDELTPQQVADRIATAALEPERRSEVR